MIGIVKAKSERGFGFILREDNSDVFFHVSGCRTPFDVLQVGERVNYDERNSERGILAYDIERITR